MAAANKRMSPRFVINPTFPIRATLLLVDKSGGAGPPTKPGFSTKTKGHAWKNWTATLIDLSTTGANLHLSLAAVGFADDPCLVKLNLGGYHLELEGTVAHFRSFTRHARCGVSFNFSDAETEKAYFQLLEPIMIGATLAPVKSNPDHTGLHKEQYAGKNAALLTVWRQTPGGEVASFDFLMNRYGVRWRTGLAELIPYQLEEQKPAGSQDRTRPVLRLKLRAPEKQDERPPELPLSEAQDEEVRWLFVLSISNLSASVATDLRVFFTALVVT